MLLRATGTQEKQQQQQNMLLFNSTSKDNTGVTDDMVIAQYI